MVAQVSATRNGRRIQKLPTIRAPRASSWSVVRATSSDRSAAILRPLPARRRTPRKLTDRLYIGSLTGPPRPIKQGARGQPGTSRRTIDEPPEYIAREVQLRTVGVPQAARTSLPPRAAW